MFEHIGKIPPAGFPLYSLVAQHQVVSPGALAIVVSNSRTRPFLFINWNTCPLYEHSTFDSIYLKCPSLFNTISPSTSQEVYYWK
jgi:hypothetical protein